MDALQVGSDQRPPRGHQKKKHTTHSLQQTVEDTGTVRSQKSRTRWNTMEVTKGGEGQYPDMYVPTDHLLLL